MPFYFLLLILKTTLIFCETSELYRTRVKVGVIVPIEKRYVETKIQHALDLFNAQSLFLIIDHISIFTSEEDTLLRYLQFLT